MVSIVHINIWLLFRDRLEELRTYPVSFCIKKMIYFTHLNPTKWKGQTVCFSFSKQCMKFNNLPPLKTCPKMFWNTVISRNSYFCLTSGRRRNYMGFLMLTHSTCAQRCRHTHTHSHMHTEKITTKAHFIHDLYTRTVCPSMLVYTEARVIL